MYGAVAEQFDLLDKKGIESIVVPGVSSVFAAAAALRTELTYPGIAQSLVLTRTPGRTPMPAGESCEAFAGTGATLAFFLSAGKLDELAARLVAAGKSPDTAAAVVYRATWPDEKSSAARCPPSPRKRPARHRQAGPYPGGRRHRRA